MCKYVQLTNNYNIPIHLKMKIGCVLRVVEMLNPEYPFEPSIIVVSPDGHNIPLWADEYKEFSE